MCEQTRSGIAELGYEPRRSLLPAQRWLAQRRCVPVQLHAHDRDPGAHDPRAAHRPRHHGPGPRRPPELDVAALTAARLPQAKTGGGKTLAFLIPAIEMMVKARFKPRNGEAWLDARSTRSGLSGGCAQARGPS